MEKMLDVNYKRMPNAVGCCFQYLFKTQILEAAPYKTAAVRPPTSNLAKYANVTR